MLAHPVLRTVDDDRTVSRAVPCGGLALRTPADPAQVSDAGPGVAEEVRRGRSDPFVTTDPAGAGSGPGPEDARRIGAGRPSGSPSCTTGPARTTSCVRLPLHRSR